LVENERNPEKRVALSDYLGPGTLVVLDEPLAVKEEAESAEQTHGIGHGHSVEQQGKEENQQAPSGLNLEESQAEDERCEEKDRDGEGSRAGVFQRAFIGSNRFPMFQEVLP
jgi:hypothetical protein